TVTFGLVVPHSRQKAAKMAEEDVGGGRLIGETDVLAAITSEYLDEYAAKKDTAAATVCLGRVLMTTFRFQFVPDEHEYDRVRRHLLGRGEDEIASFFLVPLGCIASVRNKNSVVEIYTKDLRQLSFRFDVVEITKVFWKEPLLPCVLDWDVFDDQAEWDRQGVFDNGKWRVTTCNENFRTIETYPERLVVPFAVPDEVNAGSLYCSKDQPKVGMSKATSPADESLVSGIASSSLLRDELHIIDCRPMTNALTGTLLAVGPVVYHSGQSLTVNDAFWFDSSMKKLRNLCASPSCDNLRWLGSIEDTKWLVYIRQLLKTGLHVASLLRAGESVLLHCSHGWDRTSQIVALAQLFADPYFRTWKGFQVLIEKEWLSFGHPFQLRHSHGEKADTQESPIFIQFLDCVSQLVRIYPSYFEYVGNAHLFPSHRHEANLENRTASVWTWVNGFRPQLTEQFFVPTQSLNPPPSGLLKRVVLWDAMFMRWAGQPLVQEPATVTDFFPDNGLRTPTWQMPQGTVNTLNAALTIKYREAQLIQELKERIATLELKVKSRRGSRH
ncbi:hypothetical protein BBJ28_00019705, partial [Nothophytophthora sp. Chile5]